MDWHWSEQGTKSGTLGRLLLLCLRGTRNHPAESYLMVSSISEYFPYVTWLSLLATKSSVPSPSWHRCRSLRCCSLYKALQSRFSLRHAHRCMMKGLECLMPGEVAFEPRVTLRAMLPLTQPGPLCLAVSSRDIGRGGSGSRWLFCPLNLGNVPISLAGPPGEGRCISGAKTKPLICSYF